MMRWLFHLSQNSCLPSARQRFQGSSSQPSAVSWSSSYSEDFAQHEQCSLGSEHELALCAESYKQAWRENSNFIRIILTDHWLRQLTDSDSGYSKPNTLAAGNTSKSCPLQSPAMWWVFQEPPITILSKEKQTVRITS